MDITKIVEACGGRIAHPDADRRAERGGDFILGNAAIELKILDEDGFQKSERQVKLATLFQDEGFKAPVVVLDRGGLSEAGRRTYDRAIEGPIKTAVASARRQLKQTRTERSETSLSILWILNNGYTAFNHEELTALVERRARNDTSSINAIIVGGCYFHSDGFDSFFLWPLDHVPIQGEQFTGFDALKRAWDDNATEFMSGIFRGDPQEAKGPVVDSEFEYDGRTFVKPAPPIGRGSDFYLRGRPRKNSTGLTECPPVALTFPGLLRSDWRKFGRLMPDEFRSADGYVAWLEQEEAARSSGTPLQPFVRLPVTFKGWREWSDTQGEPSSPRSVYAYANDIFQQRIQATIGGARELVPSEPAPPRSILAITMEIGQDKANDLSHILETAISVDGKIVIEPIAKDLRIFHEHAVALAGAYAVAKDLDSVLWIRDRRYGWA